jgi:hypothetical protein
MKNIIIFTIGGLAGLCIFSGIFIDAFLVDRLKRDYPSEYAKSGKPAIFLNNLGSYLFMLYCLRGGYKSIPDKTLVRWFNVKRIIMLALFILMAMWIIGAVVFFTG